LGRDGLILVPVRQAVDVGWYVLGRAAGLLKPGHAGPSRLELQIGEVARGKPVTVPEVIKRLDAIYELATTSPRGKADGIACFTLLYRTITANVLRWLEEGRFESSEYLGTLDLEFAERYFQALRCYAFDRPATPMCWRVLFDNRSNPRISRLHFAVAGVNAHINFDLAFATVSTCVRLGLEFGAGDQRKDYLAVNQIFAANTLQLREQFEAEEDPELVDAVEKLFDDFAVTTTRDVAWKEAQRLWPHRHDATRMAQEERLLDSRAAVLGKGILANPFLR
ncbi:MAG TPA: DUF5995 family protein, partial [Pseudonocardiaceae bacterium]|nr:DUF5995 family protein [Pseudonocardiaceae bacterium]